MVATLLAEGCSVRETARRLGAPLTTVRRLAAGVRQIPPENAVHDPLAEGLSDRQNGEGEIR